MVDIETLRNHPFGLTREGIDLALYQLQLTRRAAIRSYTSADGRTITLVKVAGANKTVTSITEHERNLFDLHLAITAKTNQIEQLETQIQAADSKTRQLVHEKKMNLAKIQLRQKKTLEAQVGE